MTERPQIAESRDRYVYRPEPRPCPPRPGCSTVPTASLPTPIPDRWRRRGAALPGHTGQVAGRFIKDGKLHYAHNYVARAIYMVASADPVPAGRHELRFEFEPTDKPDVANGKGNPGSAQLYIDWHLVGQTDLPVTTPSPSLQVLSCGANPGSAVTPDYQAPFRFTGTLYSVTVDLSGDLIVDSEAEIRMASSRTASVAWSAKRTPDLGHPVVTCSARRQDALHDQRTSTGVPRRGGPSDPILTIDARVVVPPQRNPHVSSQTPGEPCCQWRRGVGT